MAFGTTSRCVGTVGSPRRSRLGRDGEKRLGGQPWASEQCRRVPTPRSAVRFRFGGRAFAREERPLRIRGCGVSWRGLGSPSSVVLPYLGRVTGQVMGYHAATAARRGLVEGLSRACRGLVEEAVLSKRKRDGRDEDLEWFRCLSRGEAAIRTSSRASRQASNQAVTMGGRSFAYWFTEPEPVA
jgi:hypothetical protein